MSRRSLGAVADANLRFDWRTFSPAGGDFLLNAPDGHLLGAFAIGKETADRAREWGAPRHAECYGTHSLVGFIDEIVVKSGKRSAGTGSRLLAAALDKFREIGVEAVYLRAVPEKPEWLIRLLRFYWRFGFEVIPECTEEGDASLTLRVLL